MAKVKDELEIVRFMAAVSITEENSKGRAPRENFKFLEEIFRTRFLSIEDEEAMQLDIWINKDGIDDDSKRFLSKVWESIRRIRLFIIDTDLTCRKVEKVARYELEPTGGIYEGADFGSYQFAGKIIREEWFFDSNDREVQLAQMFVNSWGGKTE